MKRSTLTSDALYQHQLHQRQLHQHQFHQQYQTRNEQPPGCGYMTNELIWGYSEQQLEL